MTDLKRRRLTVALGLLVATLAAIGTWRYQRHVDTVLPYITDAGRARVAYYDRQIAAVQARADTSLTDVDYAVALTAAVIDRARATGDGRDIQNALAVVDEVEARITRHTRTERGATRLPELRAARARVLMANHHFTEAREIAESALRKYPNESVLAAIAGEAAVQSGDLRAGGAYLRRLVQTEPTIPNNLIGLAHWAERSGDLEQASELLTRAPDVSFPKPVHRLRLAYIYAVHGDIQAKLGRLQVSRRYYEAALKEEPSWAAARAGLADLARYEGRDAEAETLLRALIASEWPNAEYQVRLADLLSARADDREAATLRKQAERYYRWSVKSGFDGYLRPLAQLELADGDFEDAADHAARDLELRPNEESRTIYRNILAQAAAAGYSLDGHPIAGDGTELSAVRVSRTR